MTDKTLNVTFFMRLKWDRNTRICQKVRLFVVFRDKKSVAEIEYKNHTIPCKSLYLHGLTNIFTPKPLEDNYNGIGIALY